MTVARSPALIVSGLILLSGVVPAAAADDGYDNVLSSVATSIGLMSADAPPEIDYRERAPLVIPPKMELVKPAQTAARPASWPQDPDVARRRKAAAEARAPMPNVLGNARDEMSKDDLLRGRVADTHGEERPEIAVRTSECGQSGDNCLKLNPDKLRAEGEYYRQHDPDTQEQDLKAGEESERVYLTQPPKGYMKATRIVKATTEAPKQGKKDTRNFTGDETKPTDQ